jgi:SAM-dependent methyltransferase
MPDVAFVHSPDIYTLSGARAALERLFAGNVPDSVLDVGCGTGTWLRAALELGAGDVRGIDGARIPRDALHIPREHFIQHDLLTPINLGRTFDVVFCLEVAEHLPEAAASQLVAGLVAHSDVILFSAAVPGQGGQHHVNCQWPEYWQHHFNVHGYACDDRFRWEIWDLHEIEPWYRQNVFIAKRAPGVAGTEPRIKPVVHPDMLDAMSTDRIEERLLAGIEAGAKPISWYISLLPTAAAAAFARRRPRTRRIP